MGKAKEVNVNFFNKKKKGKITTCDFCRLYDYCLNIFESEDKELWLCEECRRYKTSKGASIIDFIEKEQNDLQLESVL